MKRKLIALTVGAVLLIPGANVFAKAEHGTVNMDRNGFTTMTIENAGGGYWDHDFSLSFPYIHWSNYNHTSKTHKSSAGNLTQTVSSQWALSTGGMTFASISDTATGNTANWDTK